MKIKEDGDDVIVCTARCDQLNSSILYRLKLSDDLLWDFIQKRIAWSSLEETNNNNNHLLFYPQKLHVQIQL